MTLAAVTSQIKPFGRIAPILPAGQPFRLESQVLAFQVTTASFERLEDFIGRLTPEQMAQVEDALRLCWGL